MVQYSPQLDTAFAALSDPTRRGILEHLGNTCTSSSDPASWPAGRSGGSGRADTFEWDGMPAYVFIETHTLDDLGDGRTKVVTTLLAHTTAERDGMLGSGMEKGFNESMAALDRVLASMN